MDFRKGFIDRIVERALEDPRLAAQNPDTARPPWLNLHAWTAICCGVILLLVTYGFTEDDSFFHDASHEIGFALIVAVLIWTIFEVASKEESDKTWNDRIDRISKNVFFGVLGRDLSPGIITEARFVALDHAFERSDLHVTYHLADASYTDRSGQQQSFVALRATTRFRIRNISDKQATFPVGIGLPNPLINEMKTYCRVDKVCIRNGEDVEDLAPLLAAANTKLQEDLVNDRSYQVNFKAKDIVLKPGDDREIILEYAMAKEDEDTEILQTRYPTSSLTVTLVDTGARKRLIQARSIHRLSLDTDDSGAQSGIYVYRLEKFILPYQGFAIWWKKRPPASTNPVVSS